jgi:uncharacterized protein (TIGR02300 family)
MAIAALALAPATRRLRLAKPEWGTKRICQSCGARFYDFGRSPITCPASPGARAAVAAVEGITAAEAELGPEVEADEVEEEVEAEEDEAVVEPDDEAEEDDSLIEDASELGDDEDMSDVIEGGIDEEPR